jgi:hypothetical protein
MMKESNVTMSEEEFISAFCGDMEAFIELLEWIFGRENVSEMIRKEQIATPGGLMSYPIGGTAVRAYRYAERGEFLVGWHMWANIDFMQTLLEPISKALELHVGLGSSDLALIVEKLHARTQIDGVFLGKGLLPKQFDSWINDEPKVSIDDVAIVCGMSSASVRNYTTAKAKDRLLTYKEDGKTWIDHDSLIDWLPRRRGYVKSKVVEVKVSEVMDFSNREGLNEFARVIVQNREMDVEKVRTILGLADDICSHYQMGFGQSFEWTLEQIIRLAKAAGLVDTPFIQMANKVLLDEIMLAEGLSQSARIIQFQPKGNR